MAARSAPMRLRIRTFLESAPTAFSLKLAEGAGVFAPLAPLLEAGAETAPDCVPHASLAPLWGWLRRDIAPDLAIDVVADWTCDLLGQSGKAANADLARLHAEAGTAMRHALGEPGAARRLGDLAANASVFRDFETAAALFPVARTLDALQAKWPDVIADADEPAEALLHLLSRWGEDAPELGPALLSVLLRRVADPTVILRLVNRACAHTPDEDLWRYDRVVHAVLARAPAGYEPTKADAFEPEAALQVLTAQAAWHERAEHASRGAKRDGWRDLVSAAHREAAASFETLCTRIGAHVRRALPSGGDAPPSAEPSQAALERYAVFIKRALGHAERLGFEPARAFAEGEIAQRVEENAIAGVLEAARSANGELRENALARLETLVSVTTGYVGEEAGRRLAEQAAAARNQSRFQAWFFEPAEPLVVTVAGQSVGAVDRNLFDALWRLLRDAPGDTDLAAIVAASERMIKEQGEAAAQKRVCVARRRLAPALRQALKVENRAEEARLAEALGGPDAVAAADHVVSVLEHADAIAAALADWEPGLRDLDEARIDRLREVVDQLTPLAPEAGPAALMVGARRLAKPAQILRAVARIARSAKECMVQDTDYGVIGEQLLCEAEAVAAHFRSTRRARFDDRSIVAAIDRFADLAFGMMSEFELSKDGAWGKSLFALKAQASLALSGLCKQAVEAVETATPRRVEAKSKRWLPGGAPVSDDQAADAVAYVRFLRNTAVIAERAAFASARSAALEEVSQRIEAYGDALVSSADLHDQQRARLLSITGALVAAFSGQEAAKVLKRRAAAAA